MARVAWPGCPRSWTDNAWHSGLSETHAQRDTDLRLCARARHPGAADQASDQGGDSTRGQVPRHRLYPRQLPALRAAAGLGPDPIQVPLPAQAPARRLVAVQRRTRRVHHAGAAADARRQRLVSRRARGAEAEPLPDRAQPRTAGAVARWRRGLPHGLRRVDPRHREQGAAVTCALRPAAAGAADAATRIFCDDADRIVEIGPAPRPDPIADPTSAE